MRKRPSKARSQQRSLMYLGLLFATCAVTLMGQIIPGQLPPGPPPQPGQLGPAPKKLPPSTPEPSPKSADPDVPVVADGHIIRVPVRYVLVPTTVLDPDGHGYVNGLSTSDFELLDNKHRQKIESDFVQQPLSVVLAVQANSDVEPLLPVIKKSGLLLQGLVTGEDGDAAILQFDHRIQVIQDFTNSADKLDDAMQKITTGSTRAALIDAVWQADQMLKHHDPQNIRRRVILLMSRNIDTGSEAKLQETIRDMQFDNVIVYCVDISRVLTALLKPPGYPRPANGGIPPEAQGNVAGGTGPRTQTSVAQEQTGNIMNGVPPILRGIHDLFRKSPAEAFAYFTGGNVYTFAKERALERAIDDIGKDLQSQYLLSYNPNDKNEPGFHTIQVLVDRPGLKIRTRPGYWWGGGQ